jgi:hypothetical protein
MLSLIFNNSKNPEELKQAVVKLLYEIKLRKREFLNECVKYDTDFSSKITKKYFEVALDRFTFYLTHLEKEMIVDYFLINDTFINYIDLCNIKYIEEFTYKDTFLNHLNVLKDQLNAKNIQLNAKRIEKIVDVKPLELLNYQISEENFMVKIAKKVMDFILQNTNKKSIEEYFNETFKKFNYGTDGKYTIGELNQFLSYCQMELYDYDLRFLFESFTITEGRVEKLSLHSFIQEMSQKSFGVPGKTDFIKDQKEIFSKQELDDEQKIKNILKGNYFVGVIKECLLVFGKDFMMKYFAKYYELVNNVFLIDSVWLEVGIKKLGYKDAPIQDMGNFKFLCIKKRLANLKNEMTINIDIKSLFDYFIREFKIFDETSQKESAEIIKDMNTKIFKDLNHNILSYATKKTEKFYKNKFDEFEFRRNFIENFGFSDHTFFDNLIKIMKNDDSEWGGENKTIKNLIPQNNENLDDLISVFNLQKINSKKWLEVVYNILFMGIITNYEQLGLMVDIDDIIQLKKIKENIENKMFNTYNKTRMVNKLKRGGKDTTLDSERDKIKIDVPIIQKEEIFDENWKKVIQRHFDEELAKNEKRSVSKEKKIMNIYNFKTDKSSITIQENGNNIKNNTTIKNNGTKNNLIEPVDNTNVNVNDTANLIPQLYSICTDYLKNKFKLEIIDIDIISKLGICKIFRDEIANQKTDSKTEINFEMFMFYLKPTLPSNLFKFIEHFAKQYKNKNNTIHIQYFFSKIEEVLIHYSKISNMKVKK